MKCLLLRLALASLLLPANLHAKPITLHAAPDGTDAANGRTAKARGADGPATMVGALKLARELRQSGKAMDGVTILVHGGIYELQEPLRLDAEDSGTSAAPLIIAAAGSEKPVLSGGRSIHGWTQATVNGHAIWQTVIPEVREGRWFFRQLWVNGQRAIRARHPNQGYLAVEELPDSKPNEEWTVGQSRFRFKAGDVRAWPTLTNAEVRVMNRWVESHLPVVAIDEGARFISFSKRSVFKLDPGDLYYVEHAVELLDAPGEWYLDRATGTLSYLPRPGEDMSRAEVVAPVLQQVLRFDGKPEAGQVVHDIVLRGLTFAHTEWNFPGGFDTGRDKAEIEPPPKSDVGGFGQAAIGVPGAVRGTGARDCRFEDCRFIQLGTYGLELGRGCQRNRVAGCEFADLGAGGLKLGETAIRDDATEVASDNEVSDCHIHDGGRIFHSAIGVWIGQSPGNRLRHNLIHDFYYTGISIGWTWGYSRALATNNLVEFNHVHHIGVLSNGDGPILSDMAGIYTLGLHRGSVIRNNLWHDSAGLRYGGWGIYFDEGTTEILAENNVVYRTTHGGFHQHYGKDNVVRNNVFAFARDHQVQRSREEAHRSFAFTNNVVLFDRGVLLGSSWGNDHFVLEDNLYWDARPDSKPDELKFAGATLAQWRQRGHDQRSLIADPQFSSPAKDNFEFKPGSPAFRLGIKPIDLRNVGPRPAARRGN